MKVKRYFLIFATEFFTKWPARSYLSDEYKFDVKCTVKSDNNGLFIMRYFILVEGEEKNIDNFISYLRHEGFRIKS